MSLKTESSPEEEFGFEGPEKNLQVIFNNKIYYDTGTLRSITQERYQEMLNYAKCKILTTTQNEKMTAFILSESSLFVYDDRIILKTCGTTPLLNALDDIILIGKELNLKPAAVFYWRKNFSNPHLQVQIHQSFENEANFLDEHLGGDSRKAILGPLEKDHFYLYYCELLPKNEFNPVFNTFEIKMHEIHPETAKTFFWETGARKERPEALNDIYEKLPEYKIDEFFFEPCGYSMNGIKEQNYETIHVTPESSCSYLSFETNDSKFINSNDKESAIIGRFKPFNCITIEIRNNGELPKLKESFNGDYSLASTDFVALGNIQIEFHSYETNEMHPMVIAAKRRQQKIAMMKDVKSLKVS
jgi:S-adenosylmethionine decarboxylase